MENNNIQENIRLLQDVIDSVLIKTRRNRKDISLMVVTKNASVDQILETRDLGLNLFGENYLKDALVKIPQLISKGSFTTNQFHLIGHLQSNKVKKAISLFSSIDSIDTLYLAKEVAKNIINPGKPYPIMLEIKTATDESKYGFSIDKIMDEFGEIESIKQIKIVGLMTIGTFSGSITETKRCFASLRNTKQKLEDAYHYKIPVLSMGMSDDFAIAIEEGSNMLRIGRAIFGGL